MRLCYIDALGDAYIKKVNYPNLQRFPNELYIKNPRKNFKTLLPFIYKKIRYIILDHTIYHIYENGNCLYNCLKESEFNKKMIELEGRNITYEKLPPGMGGAGDKGYPEPLGSDSY